MRSWILGVGLLVSVPQTALTQADGGKVYSLERALSVALARSKIVGEAEQVLNEADQRVREAWGGVFPNVQANARYSRNLKVQQGFLPAFLFDPNADPNELVPVRFGSDNTWTAGLEVEQPLFEYDVFIGVSTAGKFKELQVERLRGTNQQVVTAVRRAYLATLLAVEELRLTENSLERIRQTVGETRALNRAGLASDYDVLRLEVQLANFEPNLRQAQNNLDARKRELLVEMGLDADADLETEGRLNEISVTDPTENDPVNRGLLETAGLPLDVGLELDQLVEVARRHRSDLRQQRLSAELERARMAVEKADYFPRISLFANYNVTAQENGSPNFFGENPNQRTTTAATGIAVSIPIFTGLSRDARVQQAKALVRQNEARVERLELEIVNQVRTTLDQLEETRVRVEGQVQAVGQARRGFEIASAEYRAGVGSQLQITDAEAALTETEFNYAQAVFDYLSARASLEEAVGTVPETAGNLAVRSGLRMESHE